MILRLFRRNDTRETIERLYGAIVARSRDPVFYTAYAVPDTVQGRFEMILLHAFLLFHRLKDEPEEHRLLGQGVFDQFCRDMDANLREMGVGDLTVPKKMKRIAESFYGRAGAYDGALDGEGEGDLAAALARNVYGGAAPQGAAEALAHYIRGAAEALARTPFESFARGDLPLPAAGEPVQP